MQTLGVYARSPKFVMTASKAADVMAILINNPDRKLTDSAFRTVFKFPVLLRR